MENSSPKLFDPTKPSGQIISIKCSSCGYEGAPTKWEHRNILGLFLITSPLLMLVYFVFTNPYVCSNCRKRNYLTKVWNNGKHVPVGGLSNASFFVVFISLWVVPVVSVLILSKI